MSPDNKYLYGTESHAFGLGLLNPNSSGGPDPAPFESNLLSH